MVKSLARKILFLEQAQLCRGSYLACKEPILETLPPRPVGIKKDNEPFRVIGEPEASTHVVVGRVQLHKGRWLTPATNASLAPPQVSTAGPAPGKDEKTAAGAQSRLVLIGPGLVDTLIERDCRLPDTAPQWRLLLLGLHAKISAIGIKIKRSVNEERSHQRSQSADDRQRDQHALTEIGEGA